MVPITYCTGYKCLPAEDTHKRLIVLKFIILLVKLAELLYSVYSTDCTGTTTYSKYEIPAANVTGL